MKRWITMVALTACVATVAYAAEQATFIMNNGQRQSGTVVFHGGHGYNMIDQQLNLRIGNNEQSFPVNDVSVIDFVGGTPPERELQSVPASGNLIALRNGGLEQGEFLNIVNGQTVQWKNADGSTHDYPINEVSRIYLNPQGARVAYNYNGPMGQAAAGQPVGTAGQVPLPPGAVAVQANQPWTPTGVTVRKGDKWAFQTSGQIAFGRSNGQTAGADGSGEPAGAGFPVPQMATGGLIGKVGNSAPFPIGSNSQPIVMPETGQLMLGVNDAQFGDNTGYFTVVITKR